MRKEGGGMVVRSSIVGLARGNRAGGAEIRGEGGRQGRGGREQRVHGKERFKPEGVAGRQAD